MNPEIARKFEANQETGTGVPNDKLGMWIFLSSEVIFFAVLISSVVALRLRDFNIWAEHQGHGTEITLATINTFILIMSSVFVVSAIDAIQKKKPGWMKFWLVATFIGGCTFLYNQSLEWDHLATHLEPGPQESIFAAAFYATTGFHGLHVLIGVLLLLWVMMRAFRGDFTAENYNGLEIFGLYWHFVDLVWIILFTVLYLI